ncbi:MAG: alpha/beta fold hydrolase [Desulfarculus sp.]|nr:alpha/beta fold hydrolase [Desulfarculus sp.]
MARPFDHLPPVLRRLGPPPAQARRELLLLPGAWRGPEAWQGLAGPLAGAGYGLNLLELPGHGPETWDLPAFTSLRDYADLARRAAGALGRPVLLGQGLGGWLAQKILEVADLPALLLAPWPGGGLPWPGVLALARTCPRGLLGLLAGRPLALEPDQARRLGLTRAGERLVAEPARVVLEMLLGLARAKPPRGRAPRLVLALAGHPLLPQVGQARLAARLGASLTVLPAGSGLAGREDRDDIIKIALDFLGVL